MPLATKLHLAFTAALLATAAFLAHQWLAARDAYLRAEAQSQASQSALVQLAKQQSDLAAQLKQSQADAQSQLAALQKQYSKAQSPEQLAALITAAMNLPQPITITTPPATPDNPNPQPSAQVPLPDAPQAKAFVEQCQECSIRLTAAQKESAIAAEQLTTTRQELAITQKDRDTWKSAAKGGSWPRRAAKRAAAFALDAALTAAALCASGHCK
jgi:hypothetical protein